MVRVTFSSGFRLLLPPPRLLAWLLPLFLLFPAASPAGAGAASSEETPPEFEKALSAYNAGAEDEARRALQAIADQGKLSAPLCHNLGNLEYRRGEKGLAALWYRRALALDPFLAETRQNLRFLGRQTGFLQWDRPGLAVSWLPRRGLAVALAAGVWTVAICAVWLIWWTPRPGRRWPLVTLLCVAAPLSAGFAALDWHKARDPWPVAKRWVVTERDVTAFTAPAEAAATVINLPPGSEVIPLEARGNWRYCAIPGGDDGEPLRGWVRETVLQPLWPWPARE